MSSNTTMHVAAANLTAVPSAAEQTPPAVRPGHRLVPALIGTLNHHQVAHIECPDWCAEDHMDEPSALNEITHYADNADVEVGTFLDPDTLRCIWSARIVAEPSAASPKLWAAHIVLDDQDADEARLTPDMAETLADDLVGFAAHLRQLARTVRTVNQAAGASSDLAAWSSLTRTDLQSKPIADLIRVFGVTVREDDEIGDKLGVVLSGEPGEMLLLVHPSVPQNVREYETRKALLAWHDAQFGGDRG